MTNDPDFEPNALYEDLYPLLDDNKVLVTPEEKIPLPENTRIVLITAGLNKWTPALVSRLGNVYLY